ncbi:MAG: hypothetical protein J6R60_00400 [Clostridia bacterium]|nr:hypothetical protein [Clostridia bacterium]
MLRKILKYDLKYVFKYWWILAVTSVPLSVVGGISFNNMISAAENPNVILMLLSFLGFMAFTLGISAIAIGNEFFIGERFYRNFFSDEGYLTFTLPVKRSTLLNSKILMALIVHSCSLVVLTIDSIIFFALSGVAGELLSIFNTMQPPTADEFFGITIIISILVVCYIIWAILSSISSSLLLMCCITFASVITKKNKVLAAVGIYYLVSMIYAFVLEFAIYFGSFGYIFLMARTPETLMPISLLLIIFVVLGTSAAVALGLYCLEYWMLNKKLNLA